MIEFLKHATGLCGEPHPSLLTMLYGTPVLGYVIYINNCNLPSLFSSFNNVDTTSSTFMRLSEVLKNYFTNKQSSSIDNTFQSIFGELEDKIKIPDSPEDKAKTRLKDWKKDNPEATPEQEKTKNEELIKEETDLNEQKKKEQYEENKAYKEPKFNIFLCPSVASPLACSTKKAIGFAS